MVGGPLCGWVNCQRRAPLNGLRPLSQTGPDGFLRGLQNL